MNTVAHQQVVNALGLADKVEALTALGLQYASECAECNGTRLTCENETCDVCADIWEVLTKCGVSYPDNDPTPWCAGCGSMTQAGCDCGPICEMN